MTRLTGSSSLFQIWYISSIQILNQKAAKESFLILCYFSQHHKKQRVNKIHILEEQSTTKMQCLANACLCWSQGVCCCPSNSTFVPPPQLSILCVSNNSHRVDHECWHRASAEFPLLLRARTDRQPGELCLRPVKKQRMGKSGERSGAGLNITIKKKSQILRLFRIWLTAVL